MYESPNPFLPILQPPEFANEAKRRELVAARDTMQLVYDTKVAKEEMLSIFDELHTYVPELSVETLTTGIQQDRKGFLTVLRTAIDRFERESVEEKEGTAMDASSIRHREAEIQARVFGNLTRAAYLLAGPYARRAGELAAQTDEERLMMNAFVKTTVGPVKESLKELAEMKAGIRSAAASKKSDVVRSAQETAAIYGVPEENIHELNTDLEDILREAYGQDFHLAIEEKYDRVGNIVDKDFFTAYVNYSRELRNLVQQLNHGKIVETAYVRDIIERAMPALTKDPPTIVYFHGDFGTGKTALAKHISRTRFGKEPLIVAGSKFLEPDRFTEEFKIKKLGQAEFLNQMSKEIGSGKALPDDAPTEKVISELVGTKTQLRERIARNGLREAFIHDELKDEPFNSDDEAQQARFETYVKARKGKDPERRKDIDGQLDALFANPVQGRYVLGAMYTAMKEGRPLIIDEANAITPEVLIAFNDLLLKKIGDTIRTRADVGSFEIKKGYCVMWTGNTGDRYKQARYNDMDPASYSRLMPIEYRYLPQGRAVNDMDTLLKRLKLDELADVTFGKTAEEIEEHVKETKTRASSDQIFQVLLCKMLNRRMGTEVLAEADDRYSVVKDLYKLSMGARIIMDMFEGRADKLPRFADLDKIVGSNDPTVLMGKLKKSNLTLRDLIDNVVGGYLDEGQSMDIEFYLYKFVQKYAGVPEEQAILHSILQKVGFFEQSKGWPDVTACASAPTISAAQSCLRESLAADPVNTVGKYKKIRKNGDFYSMLNTNGKYALKYISSVEAVQLMFGYLPPRKVEEYEELQRVHSGIVEARKGKTERDAETEQRKRDLLESINEIIDSLRPDHFSSLAEQEELSASIDALQFQNEAFLHGVSEKEFLAEVDTFNEILLAFLRRTGKISEEDAQAAAGETPEARLERIKEVLQRS